MASATHATVAPSNASGADGNATQTLLVSESCPSSMRKRAFWSIDQFHILKKLGSGYASTVYLGTCRATGNQVAVKMYHKSKLSELNYFQISREIRIHAAMDHQNIVQLWSAFEDTHGVYLISEFAAKGDVFSDVERRGGSLSESDTVRQIIYPFLCALQYLHGNNIIHRDIKPENLLLNAMGVLKVADFGLSINIAEERPVTRVGTLDYMSPEVVVCPDKSKPHENKEMKHLYYTPLVDAWAVGVLAYELIVGKPPFDRGNKKATVQEILTGEVVIPPVVGDEARHFISWALTRDQRKRPNIADLMEHPWVTENMAQPTVRRGVTRADSFVEPKGMRQPGTLDSRDSQSMESTVQAAQHQAMQSGRMLQTSQSMSAVDMMRFRDVRLELIRAEAAAKSRAGSNSGVPPPTPPAQERLDKKPSQAEAVLSSGGVKRELQHGATGAITAKKSVVVLAADPHDSPRANRTPDRAAIRKQVSFSAKQAQGSPGPAPPSGPSSGHSPLVRSRTFTQSDTSRSRSQGGTATAVSSSGAQQQQGLGTPTTSGPRPLIKALSQSTSPGRFTPPGVTVQELQSELNRLKTLHDANGSNNGPPSPTRPFSGAPLLPSKQPTLAGLASTPGSSGHSSFSGALPKPGTPQLYQFGELQRSQQKSQSRVGQEAIGHLRQPTSCSGVGKPVDMRMPAADTRMLNTWEGNEMQYELDSEGEGAPEALIKSARNRC